MIVPASAELLVVVEAVERVTTSCAAGAEGLLVLTVLFARTGIWEESWCINTPGSGVVVDVWSVDGSSVFDGDPYMKELLELSSAVYELWSMLKALCSATPSCP
jgi:hypothetical protein